jgi:hypothetical protein
MGAGAGACDMRVVCVKVCAGPRACPCQKGPLGFRMGLIPTFLFTGCFFLFFLIFARIALFFRMVECPRSGIDGFSETVREGAHPVNRIEIVYLKQQKGTWFQLMMTFCLTFGTNGQSEGPFRYPP